MHVVDGAAPVGSYADTSRSPRKMIVLTTTLMHRELARASPLLEYLRLSHGSLLDLNVT